MLAFVQFLLFVISCYSAQLKTDYAVDETFSVANSPYYVSADAVIRDGVTITVENGVEIIFMGDYTIHVRGTFDFCNVDTSITTDRGLYLATKGYIHADSSLVRQGSIAFDSGTNGKGLFCNVLFENLNIAINTDRDGLASPYVVTVDNCEFSDIFRVFDGESFVGDVSLFTDSYFHNIDEVAYQSQATFQNCLFENFGTILADSSFNGFYFTFTGNTITGDGTQNCFKIQRSTLEYNTIDNCNIAIKTDTYYNTIQYNVLSNHNVAVDMGSKTSPDTDAIHYNNFIGNTINLRNTADTDEPDCYDNYFGSSSTDQSVIASTINDTCDGTQSFGLVTFWPWFISEYVVGEGVPVSYTFDYTGCASIDSAVSYQLPTSSPTTAPTTADPTDAPTTADPTNAPTTADPTRYPTRDPTAPPTTADPTTAEPTYNPTTSSPTTTAEATTANPSNSPSTVDQIVYSTEETEETELDVYGDSHCERAACFVCVLVVFFAFSFLY